MRLYPTLKLRILVDRLLEQSPEGGVIFRYRGTDEPSAMGVFTPHRFRIPTMFPERSSREAFLMPRKHWITPPLRRISSGSRMGFCLIMSILVMYQTFFQTTAGLSGKSN